MENRKEKIALNDELLDKVSGGYNPWGQMCYACGGIITDDPSVPYEVRCHCNDG